MCEVFWLSLFLPLLLKCLVDTILIMSSSMALEPLKIELASHFKNQYLIDFFGTLNLLAIFLE